MTALKQLNPSRFMTPTHAYTFHPSPPTPAEHRHLRSLCGMRRPPPASVIPDEKYVTALAASLRIITVRAVPRPLAESTSSKQPVNPFTQASNSTPSSTSTSVTDPPSETHPADGETPSGIEKSAAPELVGMARLTGDSALHIHLLDVAVHPNHRRLGIAGRMVDDLLSWIDEFAPGAYVDLIADGDGAEGMYMRRGFERCGGRGMKRMGVVWEKGS